MALSSGGEINAGAEPLTRTAAGAGAFLMFHVEQPAEAWRGSFSCFTWNSGRRRGDAPSHVSRKTAGSRARAVMPPPPKTPFSCFTWNSRLPGPSPDAPGRPRPPSHVSRETMRSACIPEWGNTPEAVTWRGDVSPRSKQPADRAEAQEPPISCATCARGPPLLRDLKIQALEAHPTTGSRPCSFSDQRKAER